VKRREKLFVNLLPVSCLQQLHETTGSFCLPPLVFLVIVVINSLGSQVFTFVSCSACLVSLWISFHDFDVIILKNLSLIKSEAKS